VYEDFSFVPKKNVFFVLLLFFYLISNLHLKLKATTTEIYPLDSREDFCLLAFNACCKNRQGVVHIWQHSMVCKLIREREKKEEDM